VGKGATVERLTLRDISTQNETGHTMPLLANHGHIRNLTVTNVESGNDPMLVNFGRIDHMN
jgi:hypothetical protein